MTRRFRIVDADVHVNEPHDLWARYLEPALRHLAPTYRRREEPEEDWAAATGRRARLYLACEREGISPDVVDRALANADPEPTRLELGGELLMGPVMRRAWQQASFESFIRQLPLLAEGFSASAYVERLREMGVERAFLYPSIGLLVLAVEGMEPRLAAGLMRAYNDWLRDYCAQGEGVLVPVGALCRHDPEAMVAELERVAGWGWKAVTLRPNPLGGRLLGDPVHERFWTRCEELGIAVGLHGGPHSRLPTAGDDRFRSHFALHATAHPVEQMFALLSLIEAGVLERHPRLRVAFLEGGSGWLPFWLWHLDNEYAHNGWDVREHVRMRPSDYFRRQCFIACEPEEPAIEQIIDTYGEGCVLYGSDFPHLDHASQVDEDAALLARRLSPRVARRVLWDNGCRFYGLGG